MRYFGSSKAVSREQKSARCGFTLVEAVVGTVLIGVFASATFLAFRVHNEQLRAASDTLQAVAFADEQLDALLRTKGPVKPATGGVPGRPDWQWSISIIRREALAGARADIARLQVIRPDGRVLVSTDVVSHAEPPRTGGATL